MRSSAATRAVAQQLFISQNNRSKQKEHQAKQYEENNNHNTHITAIPSQK